jgi:starch phosphorylase
MEGNDMLNTICLEEYGKDLHLCSNEECFHALMKLVAQKGRDRIVKDNGRKVYYISAEFLIGKLLSNNLINLGIYDEVKEELTQAGKNLSDIEELEVEPSLGNGGLGRLAACFLDSIANLGLNGDGIGLNYHLGLFKQVFENGKQKEVPNPWIGKDSWLVPTDVAYTINFGEISVVSRMYDINVYGEKRTNKLHLFDVETVDESIVKGDSIDFDKSDIAKNLTLFLYPDDSDEQGRLLRIYQQYFMVSNGARLILDECREKCINTGKTFKNLSDLAVIQINDTHPTMVIPELIRLLTENGDIDGSPITMDEAIDIVSKSCAYTNHTILAEALEKWPVDYLNRVVPQLMPIIKELDRRVRGKYTDKSVYIIDDNNLVHMAHIDIHYGMSVNGVAKLHTEILENTELNNFYRIYPEKFNNKTNGITFRRWLIHFNNGLAKYIETLIGSEYRHDAEKLKNLLKFAGDKNVYDNLLEIKTYNKRNLAEYLKQTQGIEINPQSIFDIQIKRLHEYKRQQMNALYIIYKYFDIKAGNIPKTPVTVIFGAKAAPAYTIAKDIIHLILTLSKVIEADKDVSPYLKVVLVQNYNVTLAEKLIPACDISEQISLASKEASGTGNMKFMLNGAVTLGTMDGANVEIAELVGKDNIYTFGATSDEVIAHYEKCDYNAKKLYETDALIKKCVDFIISDAMLQAGDSHSLNRLYNEIVGKDWFMALLDLRSYIETKEKALTDYDDRYAWAEKMLVNIANAGFFSSDRTIKQYNEDIWHL